MARKKGRGIPKLDVKLILKQVRDTLERNKEEIDILKNQFFRTKPGEELKQLEKVKKWSERLNFENANDSKYFLHYFMTIKGKCKFAKWIKTGLEDEQLSKQVHNRAKRLRKIAERAEDWRLAGGDINAFLESPDVVGKVDGVRKSIVGVIDEKIKSIKRLQEEEIETREKEVEKTEKSIVKIATSTDDLKKRGEEMNVVEEEIIKNLNESIARLEWIEHTINRIYENWAKEKEEPSERKEVSEKEKIDLKNKIIAQLEEMARNSEKNRELIDKALPEVRYLEVTAKRLESQVKKKLASGTKPGEEVA